MHTTTSYIAFCFPHWSSIEQLIAVHAAPQVGKARLRASLTIILPESSLVLSRSSKHKFFDLVDTLGGASYVVYLESLGWRRSSRYRWVRGLAILDKVIRSIRLSSLVPSARWPFHALAFSQGGTKLLACPSVFSAHDRSGAVIEAIAGLSTLSSELTFHGNLLRYQLSEILPDPIPNSVYYVRTKDEEEALLAKGWVRENIKALPFDTPESGAGSCPRLLFLSRGSDDRNNTAVSGTIEMEAIRWISEAATQAGLQLVVRLHPAELRLAFILKWARSGLLFRCRRFQFDTSFFLRPADLVVTLHSSAILAVPVPIQRAVETFPHGMLNERVGGPLLGFATRQGSATTVYSLSQLIRMAEEALRGGPADCTS